MIDSERVTVTRKVRGLPKQDVPAKAYFDDFAWRIDSIIEAMENVCYVYEGGKPKDEWNEYAMAKFSTFRKKMLDISDEVRALCDNMNIAEEPESKSGLFRRR